jgi:putative transposase
VDRASIRGHFWSPSYLAASCGGAPLSIIRQYIEQQQRPA